MHCECVFLSIRFIIIIDDVVHRLCPYIKKKANRKKERKLTTKNHTQREFDFIHSFNKANNVLSGKFTAKSKLIRKQEREIRNNILFRTNAYIKCRLENSKSNHTKISQSHLLCLMCNL